MTAWIDTAELSRIVGTTFLHFLWQGTLVAAIVAVTLELLRRSSASARYAVAVFGLFVVAAAPVVTALWLGILDASVSTPVAASSAGVAPLEAVRETPWILAALAAFWGIGATLFWLRFTAQWLYTIRLRMAALSEAPALAESIVREFVERSGIRRSVRVFESGLACVPVVVGWLRPVILLPASAVRALSPEELRAVMLHELAHIRRHDGLINLVQAIVESTLFFHPAVWWISHRIRTEREYCCDDLVAGRRAEAVTYARALFLLDSLSSREAEPMTIGSTGGPLMQRISRITGQDLPARRRAIAWMAPILVAAAAVTTFAAFRPATACPPDKEAEAAELTMRERDEERAARDLRVAQAMQQPRRAQEADARAAEIAELEAAREQMRKRLAEVEARLEAMRAGREAHRAHRQYDEWRRDAGNARQAELRARYEEERARHEEQRRQQVDAERRSFEEAEARYEEQRQRELEADRRRHDDRRAREHAEHEARRRQAEEDRMRYLEQRQRELEADRRRTSEEILARSRAEADAVRARGRAEADRAAEEAARVEAENHYRAEVERARAQAAALEARQQELRAELQSRESSHFSWDEAHERARHLEAEAARLRDLAEVERARLGEAESIRRTDRAARARDAEIRVAEARRRLDELAAHAASSDTKAADVRAALEDAKAKLERLADEGEAADDAARQRASDRVKQLFDQATRHRAEAESLTDAYQAMRLQYEEQIAQQREGNGNQGGSCDVAGAIGAQRELMERAAAEAKAAAMAAREQAKVRQAQLRAVEEAIRQADPTSDRNVTVEHVLDQAVKRLHDQETKLDDRVRQQLLERVEETRWRLEHQRQVEKQKAAEIEALRQRLDMQREQEKLEKEKQQEPKEAKPERRELHVQATPEAAAVPVSDTEGGSEAEVVVSLPIGLDAYLQRLRLDKTAGEETSNDGMSF